MQAPIVPPLLDLPLDLLVVVLVPLLPLSSLSSLLRTCSAIHTQLRPLLYHTLDLRAPAALEAFARAHSTTDDSLPFVRHLLVPNQPYKTLHAFLSAFLPSFPELHTLHLPLSDLTDTSPLLALPPACTVSITSSGMPLLSPPSPPTNNQQTTTCAPLPSTASCTPSP